jgi:hypothetical protein
MSFPSVNTAPNLFLMGIEERYDRRIKPGEEGEENPTYQYQYHAQGTAGGNFDQGGIANMGNVCTLTERAFDYNFNVGYTNSNGGYVQLFNTLDDGYVGIGCRRTIVPAGWARIEIDFEVFGDWFDEVPE